MRQQRNLPMDRRRRNPAIPCLEATLFLPTGLHYACPRLGENVVVWNHEKTFDKKIEAVSGFVTPAPGLGPIPKLRHALKAEGQGLSSHMTNVSRQDIRPATLRMQQACHGGIQKNDTHRSGPLPAARRRAARSVRTCSSNSSGFSSEGHNAAIASGSSTGATPCTSASSSRDREDQNEFARSECVGSVLAISTPVSSEMMPSVSYSPTESTADFRYPPSESTDQRVELAKSG